MKEQTKWEQIAQEAAELFAEKEEQEENNEEQR